MAAAKANAAREAPEPANDPETTPGSSFSAPPLASEPDSRIGDKPAAPSISLGPARVAEPDEPVEAIPDLVIRPPRQRTSLPAVIEARPKTRPPIKIVIALMVLVVVAGAATAAYLFRDDIVPMLPSGWRTMLHLAP